MMTEDQARELNSSMYWTWIQDEIKYRISLKANELRKCSADKLVSLQTGINVYEEFLRLPSDVKDREEGATPTGSDSP